MSAAKSLSASESIVIDLRGMIESGELKPGQRLESQATLAKQYGVGMSSVREAINALEATGYLEVAQGRGTFVSFEQPLKESLISGLEAELKQAGPMQLFRLREMLEAHAAREAATSADGRAVAEIGRQVERLHESAIDRQAYLAADQDFHQAVAMAGRQQAAWVIINLIHDLMHRSFPLVQATQSKDYRRESVDTARDVYEAIRSGDPGAAARSMRAHLSLLPRAMDAAPED